MINLNLNAIRIAYKPPSHIEGETEDFESKDLYKNIFKEDGHPERTKWVERV